MSGPIRWLAGHLSRVRVTLLYAAALAAVAELLLRLSPSEQRAVILDTSTNLHNLGEGRLLTLVGSAFVNQAGPLYYWLPGLVALLALAELIWQSRRMLGAFLVGHLGATAIVAAGLAAAVAGGRLPATVAGAADVGMSYGAIAVLGTLTAALPPRWRSAWAGWWLAVALGSTVLGGFDFTAAGHLVALLLGIAVGARFRHPPQWTTIRGALLVVAAGFGYLLLTYQDVMAPIVPAIGLLGAVCCWAVSAVGRVQTNSSAEASIQSDSQASGGLSSNSPGISHS